MINLTVKLAQASFFDRKAVMDAVDPATRRALSRFGAFVRQRARTSIRPRREVSRPGSPPSSHVGTLRRLIFFAFDRESQSVVIGPTLFRPDSRVPGLLEYGGEATGTGPGGQTRRLRYRPRPYMGPAFEAELPSAPALWQDSIKK